MYDEPGDTSSGIAWFTAGIDYEKETDTMKYVCSVCGWVYDEDEAGTKTMFARENRARERYNKCRAMDCKMEAGSYFEEK